MQQYFYLPLVTPDENTKNETKGRGGCSMCKKVENPIQTLMAACLFYFFLLIIMPNNSIF